MGYISDLFGQTTGWTFFAVRGSGSGCQLLGGARKMNEADIANFFAPYWSEFVNLAALENRPLLAQYTTLSAIESILKSNELWFSNPLFMNDLEEMRFGMLEGQRLFSECFDGDAFAKIWRTFRASYVNQKSV